MVNAITAELQFKTSHRTYQVPKRTGLGRDALVTSKKDGSFSVMNVLKPCRPRNFSKRNMCGGCGVDTGWDGLGEWFTIRNEIWERVWPGTSNGKLVTELNGPRHFLCIGYLEKELGRKLTPDDFEKDNILNRATSGQSKRLRDRLRGV